MKSVVSIAIMIITVSTVGFGMTLNSNPLVQKIGAENDTPVENPDVNITRMTINKSVNNAISADITVRNEAQEGVHTYKVCVIITANGSLTEDPGTTSFCSNTASIDNNQNDKVTITFTNSVDVRQLDYWSLSIQEIG